MSISFTYRFAPRSKYDRPTLTKTKDSERLFLSQPCQTDPMLLESVDLPNHLNQQPARSGESACSSLAVRQCHGVNVSCGMTGDKYDDRYRSGLVIPVDLAKVLVRRRPALSGHDAVQ